MCRGKVELAVDEELGRAVRQSCQQIFVVGLPDGSTAIIRINIMNPARRSQYICE
jgi:hypothetical protein